MRRKEGQVTEAVGDEELLYRRCPPDYIEGTVVLEGAVKEHNLSVLRSRHADPDDARWDSRIFAEARGREPLVYPEFFVVEIAVSAIPKDKTPEFPNAAPHQFNVVHVPFDDNYAHCEVHILRDGKHVAKEGNLTGGEGKAAKKHLRMKLAEAARIRLRPNEGSTMAGAGTRASS